MFKRYQKPIIALILLAALSFGAAFGVYIYMDSTSQPISNTKPPVSLQPTAPQPPEPTIPDITKPALETDMCGESLLGKTLPNIKYPEFAQTVLDRMLREYSIFESPAADGIPVPEGADPNDIVAYIIDNYHYLTSELSYSYPLIRYPDKFIAWSLPEKIECLNAVYTEAERIIEFLSIDETVSQEEAMVRINAYICENKAYAYGEEDTIERSTYHAMFAETGVCEHYALEFQVLCLAAGIECHYIVTVPEEDGTTHAFNKVYFSDGSHCWIDVCWNDNRSQNEAGEWVETSTSNGFDAVYVFEKRMEYMFLTDTDLQRIHENKGYHKPVVYFKEPALVPEDAPTPPKMYGTAADTDMCGESLILKEQPHTQFKNVIEYVLKCLYTPDELENLVVSGLDENAIISEINTKYRYLTDAITVKASNGEVYTFESDNYTNQLMAVVARADEIIAELGITENTTQVEAIKRINQWLIDNKNYDFTFSYTDSFVFVGLYEPDIICCHYSLAFQALCLAAGIECEYIEVLEMNHAWNKVIFSDGSHLWVDTTWNDCYMDAERYLLLTDTEMAETHQLP